MYRSLGRKLLRLKDYIFLQHAGYDEDEPPLTEDEIEGLKIAEQEIAEGKGIPFEQLLKELGE